MNLFSIHLGYVLGSLPFADRFEHARKLGFRSVEIPFPYTTPADFYADLLTRHGLQQISIGAPTGDYRKGQPGFAVDPGLRDRFMVSLERAAAYAERIGCSAIHVFSGCRNPAISEEETEATYCQNLAAAAAFLADRGIITLVEPINATDFPGYYLDSLGKAERVIAEVGSPQVRLIFDVYHVRMMGEDPAAAFRAVHPRVEHVQFADYPGRHEPGTGILDYAAIVGAMRETGYAGSAGLEYIPTRPPGEPLEMPAALAEFAGLAMARDGD